MWAGGRGRRALGEASIPLEELEVAVDGGQRVGELMQQ